MILISLLSTQRGLLSFDELVAEAVDYVFGSIFGERLAFIIWTCLEVRFAVGRLDVARRPNMFSKSLEKMFGPTAARNLEGRILKRLCQMLKIEMELKKGLEFSDYIGELRKAYMKILAVKYMPLISR
ncbi:MAG: hypothetical protein RMJ15_05650 [Nitrososphaerota archaeon]|nr:hypothetical protein [Candidatus Bathyarchaeota archaeon]MDW8023200.1 hypothetical protein [Nitrososphaerota archaeon]